MNMPLWKKPPAKLSISRSGLHIWRIDLDFIDYNSEKLLFLLSPEEVKRCGRFVFQRDRYCYQVTHGMKRLILANYLDCDPQGLRFEVGKRGKPAITHSQNLLNIQFNISHSHKLILIAVTVEDPVGIDVEYHAKGIAIENLGKIIFSPLENRFFSVLKCQRKKKEAFFRCWTRKEAYLKAKGIGLITDLSSICVDMHELPASKWLTVSTFEEVAWKIFPLNVGRSYTSCVVTTAQKKLSAYNANYLNNLTGLNK